MHLKSEFINNVRLVSEIFVILASCSRILAGRSGASQILQHPMEVYAKYFWNEEAGLSSDTWNTDFTVCEAYRGLNSNMHTVEAFLAIADTLEREEYRKRAGRIINQVIRWAVGNNWRIIEHFSEKWKQNFEYNRERPDDPFKPYGATPGHGAEWARLIIQWALLTFGDYRTEALQYIEAAEKLYQRAKKDVWNVDGASGLIYTTDWAGKSVVQDRYHWVLAEFIDTAAVLAHVTGKKLLLVLRRIGGVFK